MVKSVSYIVPVYNTPENLLQRCLRSILASAVPDFEIIVVDDDSIDNTAEMVVDDLRDSRIRYYRKSHAGQGAARNFALDKATKDYIQFVDSDDFLITPAYKRFLECFCEEDCDLMLFDYAKVCDGQTIVPKSNGRILLQTSGLESIYTQKYLGVVWSFVVKRSVVGDLRFPEGLYHEDEQFLPLLLLRVDKLVVTDFTCYGYYQRSNSTVSNLSPQHISKRFFDMLLVIASLVRHADASELNERKALMFRVYQLDAALLYNIIRQSPDRQFFDTWVERLYRQGRLPLPKIDNGLKYNALRVAVKSRVAVSFLFVIRKFL